MLDFFQKNSSLYLSKYLLVLDGNSKHCTLCVGSDSKCDCMRIALPALGKQFAFQPSNFIVALLIISWKVE